MLSATETTALVSISAALTNISEVISPTAMEVAAATSSTPSSSATPLSTTTPSPTEHESPHPYIIPTAILASIALLILFALLCKRLHSNCRRRDKLNTVAQIPESRRNSTFGGDRNLNSTRSSQNTDVESIIAYTSRTASQKRILTVAPRYVPSNRSQDHDTRDLEQCVCEDSQLDDEMDTVSYDVAFTNSETSKRASVTTVLTISEVSDYAVYFDYTQNSK
ncbi:hypothetical protein BJ741DRAFT_707873 [Chytriomyces cf. hyalinus JEL632]|nr:hypothetical protein BJ741DRAFT_707873 [Chytriomyces cf. hyalinus JEL632]